jgi:hypothetical protein
MLSRKYYVEIAEILAKSQTVEQAINSIVTFCKSDNERFNESKFRNHIQKTRD